MAVITWLARIALVLIAAYFVITAIGIPGLLFAGGVWVLLQLAK